MSKLSTNYTELLNPLVEDKASLLSALFSDDVIIRMRLETILPENVLTTDSLKFYSMEIDDELAKALAKILPYTTLTSLDLGGNNIGYSGAKYLAEALKDNTTLTSLYLVGNYIGYSGINALAGALKDNTTLTSLDLGGNDIGYSGAKYLAEALKDNITLTSLDLNGNNIGDAEVRDLANLIDRNIALFKEFAERLVQDNTNSPDKILNINDLKRLKNCDKKLLEKTIGEEGATKLVTKYLHPNYFNDHAFEIIGVCEILAKNTPTEETHISDLLNENRAHIFSFLSPSDCTVSEVNTDANEVPMVGDVETA